MYRTPLVTSKLLNRVIEDVAAIAVVGLVVLGLGGIVYRLFQPEGWGNSLLDFLWSKSPWLVWFGSFTVAALTLAVKHALARTRWGSGNLVTHLLIAAGLFFLFKLVVTGSL